jgi:hypothetical protein
MLIRLARNLICAGFAVALTFAPAGSARAFAIWQGTAVIESTTGTACAENDLGVGKSLRVFFKPRNVGGNSNGSELLFVYERGSFQVRKLNADLVGAGTYHGTAVYFNLHNAQSFAFNFTASSSDQPFNFTIAPAGFSETTQNVKITGSITGFFVLFTAGVSDCDITFTANLLKKP